MRAWTAQQLGTIEGEEAAAALRAALQDPEPLVATAPAAALSKRGEPNAATPPEKAGGSTPAKADETAPPGMRIETLD